MTNRHLVRCIAVTWCLTLGITHTTRGQTAAIDPWKKVPAAPTTCFRDDAFDARLNATSQELLADNNRQVALNERLTARFNSMEPMERMRRMQDFMMKNPQAAAKMIEASANLGSDASTSTADITAATERLDKELASHKTAFDAALDQALKPLLAKQEALVKAKTTLMGEAKVPAFTTDAAYAEYVAVIGEQNAASEKVCAAFYGPKGTFNSWLDRYRADVLDKKVAFAARSDAALLQQVAIIETPDSRYLSTGPFDAAREYVGRLDQVSRFRRPKATPTIPLDKRGGA
jgi:hypothetical protein